MAISEETLQAEWRHIVKAFDENIVKLRAEHDQVKPEDRENGTTALMPGWWRSALKLLIACDEACIRMGGLSAEYFDVLRLGSARARGHHFLKTNNPNYLDHMDHRIDIINHRIDISRDTDIALEIAEAAKPTETKVKDVFFDELRNISFTFSGLADYDVVCVFPKSRVPNVGTTIRNLTNHLALLPPFGIARAHLRRGEERAFRRNTELNLLLVPFPFRISASSFSESDQGRGGTTSWFDLTQDWLKSGSGLTPEQLNGAIDILCTAARKEVKEIDMIVFPEQALDYKFYAELALHISRNHPDVEILIAGTSQRPERKRLEKQVLREEALTGVNKNYTKNLNEYVIRLSWLAKAAERVFCNMGISSVPPLFCGTATKTSAPI